MSETVVRSLSQLAEKIVVLGEDFVGCLLERRIVGVLYFGFRFRFRGEKILNLPLFFQRQPLDLLDDFSSAHTAEYSEQITLDQADLEYALRVRARHKQTSAFPIV